MVASIVCPGEETVDAYVAGKLARGDRDAFEAHLDTCGACSEVVATLAKLAEAARATFAAHDGKPGLARAEAFLRAHGWR